MLLVTANTPKRSIVDQRKKAGKPLLAFAVKYPQNQTGICPSCQSLNEFNPDLFLDRYYIEKKNAVIVPDKNNPGLTDAWWID